LNTRIRPLVRRVLKQELCNENPAPLHVERGAGGEVFIRTFAARVLFYNIATNE
jgi:hypothetical protein